MPLMPPSPSSPLKNDCIVDNGRINIVLGSSTLHNLWKERTYKPNSHIDFDCIIGNM